jgi:hypothetical protein
MDSCNLTPRTFCDYESVNTISQSGTKRKKLANPSAVISNQTNFNFAYIEKINLQPRSKLKDSIFSEGVQDPKTKINVSGNNTNVHIYFSNLTHFSVLK